MKRTPEAKRSPEEMSERYRHLPNGEALKEAARMLESKNRALANRLREIVSEGGLETADSRLEANLEAGLGAAATGPGPAGSGTTGSTRNPICEESGCYMFAFGPERAECERACWLVKDEERDVQHVAALEAFRLLNELNQALLRLIRERKA